MKSDADPLVRLEEIGFKRIGQWILSKGVLGFVSEEDVTEANVLYAFVSGREVLYIGKTARPIARRLYGYQNPGKSQLTNVYCNREIRNYLAQNKSVDVLVRSTEKASQIGSFTVNEAAALEDAIIRNLEPPWNRVGKFRRRRRE